MSKNILITRSFDRSKLFSNYLTQHGYCVYHEPLFDIENLNCNILFKNNISSIIITSFNACRAILENKFPKNIKIYAIGQQSCQILKDNGYYNIEIAKNRSVLSLIKLIKDSNKSKELRFCYLRGQVISYDLKKDLEICGFDICEFICYKTKEYQSFSTLLLNNINQINYSYILLYSQNSAKIFYNLAVKNNLVEKFKDSQIICFSQQITKMVKNLDNKIWNDNIFNYSNFKFLKNFYD